jgi:hypothetical protein
MSAPPLTVTMPGYDTPNPEIADIQARGNMPLIVGERVIAEIDRQDLLESWDTAVTLSSEEIAVMSRTAGNRLAQIVEDNLDAANITDIVTDAAVLFLLALRARGIQNPDDIQPCTVFWDEESSQEYILLQA